MCGCSNETCWGGCPCGCKHTGPVDARYRRDRRGFVGRPNPEAHDPSSRPVVVIDPEDREQVERLAKAYDDEARAYVIEQSYLQSALREFADPTPPKPDEPMGLGAVVEDSEGHCWVRGGNTEHGEDWTRQVGNAYATRTWSYVDAAKVLSEGVTP